MTGNTPGIRSRRRLFKEFYAIQVAAGVRPEGRKARYGFHDLRLGFATMNADRPQTRSRT
jgi:hypothetical protein